MGVKTYASIGQLVTGIAVLALSWVQYKHDPNTNPIFLSVFFLFTATLVIDKLGLTFANFSTERDEKDLKHRLDRLPSLFVGSKDIVTFAHDGEGAKYCVSVVPFAINIKNTVLRYKSSNLGGVHDGADNSTEWIDAKIASMTKHQCTWTEIISTHIGRQKNKRDVIDKLGNASTRFYEAKYLDELVTPMVQMSIFTMANGTKEIVFGWQFPGLQHGPCFLTRNEEIVRFFEIYFDYFYSISAE